jgi:hypothetical protein
MQRHIRHQQHDVGRCLCGWSESQTRRKYPGTHCSKASIFLNLPTQLAILNDDDVCASIIHHIAVCFDLLDCKIGSVTRINATL